MEQTHNEKIIEQLDNFQTGVSETTFFLVCKAKELLIEAARIHKKNLSAKTCKEVM